MTRIQIIAAMAATVLLLAGPLGAQSAMDEGALAVRVIPRVGLYAPDQQLYEIFEDWPLDPVQFTAAWLDRAWIVGAAVELSLDHVGLRLRGELLRTFDGRLNLRHAVRVPRVLFNPPEIRDTRLHMPATLTTAGVQLILPVRLTVLGVEPYLLAGYSAKWYGFGAYEPADVDPGDTTFPQDGFVPSLDLGAGLTYELFGVPLDLVAKDNVSRYWGWTKHDIHVMGGVAVRLF